MDFFDKMKDGITKGIDTIGAKGKELMEDTQTQLQISSLRDKRKKALEDLGALAYALCQKGALADEGAKQACETIASLEQQIAAKQAALTQAHQVGQPAAAAPAPAAGTALTKCECGAENAGGVKFCSSCGKKLG
jgi:hypothetical protein